MSCDGPEKSADFFNTIKEDNIFCGGMKSMGQVPRRPLGNTGLHVSVLGFGASPLGGVFHVRCSFMN